VALVATALLEVGDAQLAALELKARVDDIMRRLEARGAHVHVPRADQDYSVEVGFRMLRLRRLVDETDGLYRADPANAVLLRYYANSIAHLLTDKGMAVGAS